VIVTADHGEELLERGHVGHTSCNLKGTLHDESIHVPLIMRYPKRLPAGAVIRQQVSQVDLMPTLFDLLGLQLPLRPDGESLLPLIDGRTDNFRAEAYAEAPPAGWQALDGDERRIWCVRTADWKLIVQHDPTTGVESSELYNLKEDPGERVNLIDQERAIGRRLRASLDAQRKRSESCS
jgi:arylsulfatase A-like enzyme